MEQDPEIDPSRNHSTSYFRQYDGRLGRWWSNDPVTFPSNSPYNGMDNSPLSLTDPSGAATGGSTPLDPDPNTKVEGSRVYVYGGLGGGKSGPMTRWQPTGKVWHNGSPIDRDEYDRMISQLVKNHFNPEFDPASLGFDVNASFDDYFWEQYITYGRIYYGRNPNVQLKEGEDPREFPGLDFQKNPFYTNQAIEDFPDGVLVLQSIARKLAFAVLRTVIATSTRQLVVGAARPALLALRVAWKFGSKSAATGAVKADFGSKIVSKWVQRFLLPGVKLSERKLRQHAYQWGIVPDKGIALTKAQVEEMGGNVYSVYNNAITIRQGAWSKVEHGGFEKALFYFDGESVLVTQADGTMITILRNASGNKHFNAASTIWKR